MHNSISFDKILPKQVGFETTEKKTLENKRIRAQRSQRHVAA
jgi:sensor c-di-GMP phosphodiesterase-like protein